MNAERTNRQQMLLIYLENFQVLSDSVVDVVISLIVASVSSLIATCVSNLRLFHSVVKTSVQNMNVGSCEHTCMKIECCVLYI